MPEKALALYRQGYTFEEIYEQIGLCKLEYNYLITDQDKRIHHNEYKKRSAARKFGYDWNDARHRLQNSGYDLSRIILVEATKKAAVE